MVRLNIHPRPGGEHGEGWRGADFPLAPEAGDGHHRGLRQGKQDLSQQIEIIREEIERSDRIITQLMGYAQLSEGRVENLDVREKLEEAVEQVFPAADPR